MAKRLEEERKKRFMASVPETIRKIAGAPECVNGLCNAVMKRLGEKEAAEREAQRQRRRPPF